MPLYFDFCVYCGLKTCPSNDYYQLYLRSLVCSPSVMAPPHCLCRTIHCKSYHDDDDDDDNDNDDDDDDDEDNNDDDDDDGCDDENDDKLVREEFVSTYASGKIASRAPRQPVNYDNLQVVVIIIVILISSSSSSWKSSQSSSNFRQRSPICLSLLTGGTRASSPR